MYVCAVVDSDGSQCPVRSALYGMPVGLLMSDDADNCQGRRRLFRARGSKWVAAGHDGHDGGGVSWVLARSTATFPEIVNGLLL